MLRKLLKYEIKATARIFLPLYAALLFLSVINRLFISRSVDSIGTFPRTPWMDIVLGVCVMIYWLLIATIFALTAIVMIQRFY